MTVIALRSATPADSEFCFRLHKAAMGDYVRAIWGWDEQVQRDFHARAFNPGRWQIITADGADAGLLDVEYRPGEIYLSRLAYQVLDGASGDLWASCMVILMLLSPCLATSFMPSRW